MHVYIRYRYQHSYLMLTYKQYFFILVQDSPEEESIADVLLWAIFVDRKELAEVCWLRGTDHLCKNYNTDKGI